MDDQLAQSFRPHCASATEHAARLEFIGGPAASAASLRGTIEGPFCEYARTLPTTFSIAESDRSVTIVDPCYWSPRLPFLYRLRAVASFDDSPAATVDAMIGLRRWEAVGANLRLERRRIVLRGAAADVDQLAPWEFARSCDVALLVKPPDDAVCEQASRLGVPLVVDLRGAGDQAASIIRRLAWHPSVFLAMLDAAALRHPPEAGRALLVAATIGVNDEASVLAGNQASAAAVEIGPEERPPAWLAWCDRPLIAIRRGVRYANFHEARAACDRLQAELAPEFDLAGYFVAP